MNAEAEQAKQQIDEHEEQFTRSIPSRLVVDGSNEKLLANAAEMLKAEGFELQEGVTVKAVANTDSAFHLVILERPQNCSD
ncbi:NHLP leader peptide family natural product precursor [Candidatus Methylospira mobilis]|uniref:NHLP leader peptide family natural product n=1 Tax=Candidatus Methylospira mobilis TaxID=1808979 RepID=A0A5Q0BI50_9GAMM|nr:NHLP leader peptide family natural product precursor [Candidatus Methylospira mobilis]QFY43239.1 NHLP leader peptide family natural product precursor [Candidatus Methylospira mobilis]